MTSELIERLRPYLRHRNDCRQVWAEAIAGEGRSWPCTCGLDLIVPGVPFR